MEGFEAIELVYNCTHNEKYLQLLNKLNSYTLNWEKVFNDFIFTQPTNKYINRFLFNLVKPVLSLMDRRSKMHKNPKRKSKERIAKINNKLSNQKYLKTHGVNLAMAFKYLAYNSYLSNSKFQNDKIMNALKTVLKYHGTALDLFSSDEHLNGNLPDKGIELCNVVEMMYSMEEIMRVTRNVDAADYLETYLYSALPAMFTKDLCSHQYVQQTNQVSATKAKRDFYDTNNCANTFGIAPNYGCCAANLHQGFPKALSYAMLTSKNAIYIYLYISGVYTIQLFEGTIILDVETSYPFSNTATIKCMENSITKPFKIYMRKPFHADTTTLINQIKFSGKEEQGMLVLDRPLLANDIITIRYNIPITTVQNNDGTVSFRKGPIVFVNHLIEKEIIYNRDKYPFHDRGFNTKSDYRIAPLLKNKSLQIIEEKTIVPKFEGTIYDYGIELRVKAAHINNWKIRHNSLQNVNKPSVDKDKSEMLLSPYGNSILRVTHFPDVEE